jgi:hypothetical protein
VNELRVSLVCQTCARCCSVSLCVSERVSAAIFYNGSVMSLTFASYIVGVTATAETYSSPSRTVVELPPPSRTVVELPHSTVSRSPADLSQFPSVPAS